MESKDCSCSVFSPCRCAGADCLQLHHMHSPLAKPADVLKATAAVPRRRTRAAGGEACRSASTFPSRDRPLKMIEPSGPQGKGSVSAAEAVRQRQCLSR